MWKAAKVAFHCVTVTAQLKYAFHFSTLSAYVGCIDLSHRQIQGSGCNMILYPHLCHEFHFEQQISPFPVAAFLKLL